VKSNLLNSILLIKNRIISNLNFVNSDKYLLKKIARSSPNDLLFTISFWRSKLGLILLILISILITLLLFRLTYPSSDLILSKLSLFIHPFIIWGVYTSLKRIAEIDVEHAIVQEVENKGNELLIQIEAKRINHISLSTIKNDVIPYNAKYPQSAMIRMFQNICKEAVDRRFESSINITKSYQEESYKGIFDLQSIQKIALWLGILGTFIGLLLAILHINEFIKKSIVMVDSKLSDDFILDMINSNTQIFSSIQHLFSDLHISFSTSVAGLEVAVIMGFMIMYLRNRQDIFFRDMEASAITMLSLVRHADKDIYVSEFRQVNSVINELKDKVYHNTEKYSKDLIEITNTVNQQTKEMQNGIENVKLSFLKSIEQGYDNFVEKINIEFKNGIDIAAKDMTESLEIHLADIGKGLNELNNSYNNFEKSSDKLMLNNDSLNSSLLKLEATTQNQSNQIELGLSEMLKTQSEFSGFVNEIKKGQTDFIESVKNVHTTISLDNLTNEISDSLNNLNTSIVDSISILEQKISKKIADSILRSEVAISTNVKENMEKIKITVTEIHSILNEVQTISDKITQKLYPSKLLELAKVTGVITIFILGAYSYYYLARIIFKF